MTSKLNTLGLTGTLAIMCLFLCPLAQANDITVQNVLQTQNSSTQTMTIQFDISWNNSWYDNINNDAAWVFLKYLDNSNLAAPPVWHPVYLNVSPTDSCAGSSCSVIKNYYSIPTGVINPTGFSQGVCESMNAANASPCTNIDIIAPIDYYCDPTTYNNTCVIHNVGSATSPNVPYCSVGAVPSGTGATVNTTNTCGTCSGSTCTLTGGTITPGYITVGAFIQPHQQGAFASASNTGTLSVQQVKFIWNYGAQGLTNSQALQADIQVMALEMVYIPSLSPASSYASLDSSHSTYTSLGDGSASNNNGSNATTSGSSFETSTTTFTVSGKNYDPPYLMTINTDQTEPNFTVGAAAASPTATVTYSAGPSPNVTVLDTFPKGTKSFYIMKYDLTQGQMVSFLNTLTRYQQGNLIASGIKGRTSPINIYAFSNSGVVSNRNGIMVPTSFSSTSPITWPNSYNPSGSPFYVDPNPAHNVGPWIACNYVDWRHNDAIAAWSGLRPLTELEFSRAAQAPLTNLQYHGIVTLKNLAPPNYLTYPWGTTAVNWPTDSLYSGLINAGLTNEGVNWTSTSVLGPSDTGSTAGGNGLGPFRVGWASTCYSGTTAVTCSPSLTAAQSGASYWGVMDLAGGLNKPVVYIEAQTGAGPTTWGSVPFYGTNGNGNLSTGSSGGTLDGFATNSDWPGYSSVDGAADDTTAYTADFGGTRGGSWNTTNYVGRPEVRTSFQNSSSTSGDFRSDVGVRCARSAPQQ